jgi:hypothetical protein
MVPLLVCIRTVTVDSPVSVGLVAPAVKGKKQNNNARVNRFSVFILYSDSCLPAPYDIPDHGGFSIRQDKTKRRQG